MEESNLNLELAEQEVIFNFDEECKIWEAYSSSPNWIKKMEDANWECVMIDYNEDGSIFSKTFKAPEDYVKLIKRK